MKVELRIDNEKILEFDVSKNTLLKVMYMFFDEFKSNMDFMNRMSKK